MDNECVCGGWEYQAFSQGKTKLCQCPQPKIEQVNHPQHYGGKNNEYEAIKVIDAWDLGFSLGNAIKYISRAGKKRKDTELEDLRKALWYLQHHI